MEIICKKCGLIHRLGETKIKKNYLSNGGYHEKAYCENCGTFLKNLPHAKPAKLYFGKYKGGFINVIAKKDSSYLQWLIKQEIKISLKNSIIEALEALGHDKESDLFRSN
mgnify:FL=1